MLSRMGRVRVLIALLSIAAAGMFFKSSRNLSVYSLVSYNTSLCACNSCLTEGDPWFRGLMTASPKPFLSLAGGTSEETFNWWKRLQREQRPFTFYNTTVTSLFKIIPPIPDVVEPGPKRCITCAVVGNSGNLKGSHYGPLIDYHDIVIRMNHGRTKGYEDDVGTKTTHHVMYPESAINLPNTTHLMFFAFKIKDLLWLLKSFPEGDANAKPRANKDLVMILNPAFMRHVHEIWMKKRGSYPSTGFLTLAASMHMCDKVSVFGYGADSEGNWSHYFEILRNKNLRTGPHAGTHEYELIRELHKHQRISFFKGF